MPRVAPDFFFFFNFKKIVHVSSHNCVTWHYSVTCQC